MENQTNTITTDNKADPSVLFVSGNWTDTGGRTNNYMAKIIDLFEEILGYPIISYNGGHINELKIILENQVKNADIVFYAPNIPLELDERLNPKDYNYRVVLITFRRNDNRYSFEELIGKSLSTRSDLTCEVRKNSYGRYEMRVFDILGAVWSDFTEDTQQSVIDLIARAKELLSYRYFKLKKVRKFVADLNPKFDEVFQVYKEFGHILRSKQFGENSNNRIKRHLGEISFRTDKPNLIYSSARNCQLTDELDESNFVLTKVTNSQILYQGDKKPHLETGVFDKLMENYSNINYIFHSHCYVEGADIVEDPVTNGSIQEFEKIDNLFTDTDKNKSLNLKGHGSFIFANDLDFVRDQINKLYIRELPEMM